MKTILSRVTALLVMLVVNQTASAIPISASETSYSALSTLPISSQYVGLHLHSAFRLNRNHSWKNVADDVKDEAILIGVGDSLEFPPVPATVTAVNRNNGMFEKDDLSSERGSVRVPEPSIVALMAIGLVGVWVTRRKKNH